MNSFTQYLIDWFYVDNVLDCWYMYGSLLFSALAFTFNVIVLIVLSVAKLNPAKKNYYTFVRSLLTAHCMFASTEIFRPFIAAAQWTYNISPWSEIMFYIVYFSCQLTLSINLVFLCMDQYIAIVKSLRYNSILSTKKCRIMVVCSWILPALTLVPFTIYIHSRYYYYHLVMFSALLSFQGACFLTLCIFYIRMIPHIKRQLQMMSRGGTMSMWHIPHAFVTLTCILLTYALFALLPSSTISLLYIMLYNDGWTDHTITLFDFFQIVYPSIYFNCISDPLIYAIRLHEIRKAFKCK